MTMKNFTPNLGASKFGILIGIGIGIGYFVANYITPLQAVGYAEQSLKQPQQKSFEDQIAAARNVYRKGVPID
jgi:hypothetical protein